MIEAQNSNAMSTSLLRLASLARKDRSQCFHNLNQYLTLGLLETAFYQTRKDGAVGVDHQTAQVYELSLENNLQDLLVRAKNGNYNAPPVRRVYVPKGKGVRPIGIPTFEDKVLQRAVVLILERLYEPLFHNRSYGYRPGRSAHQALDYLRDELEGTGGGSYVIELDIVSFFDNLDKAKLREFLKRRINDRVILRLINKWLKAGVMDGGSIHYPEAGTPQGGVISPILANIYLHDVLDSWFEQSVKPCLINSASLVRFADDAVLIVKNQTDLNRLFEALPKRFGRFGLALHKDKTRCLVFKPGIKSSIDFLGMTHFWKRSHKRKWCVGRKTMKAKFARGVKAIKLWCKYNRHLLVGEQYVALCRKVRGHYAYFGISGNIDSLRRFRQSVQRVWIKWLRRRSQKHKLCWERASALLRRYSLPMAKVLKRNHAFANVIV